MPSPSPRSDNAAANAAGSDSRCVNLSGTSLPFINEFVFPNRFGLIISWQFLGITDCASDLSLPKTPDPLVIGVGGHGRSLRIYLHKANSERFKGCPMRGMGGGFA